MRPISLQTSIIRDLASWVVANPWSPSQKVLYDLCSQGNPGESKKCPLYIGTKERGRGRATQIVQPDILVRQDDSRRVDLVIEVDIRRTKTGKLVAPRPKDLIGLLLGPPAADCHMPSHDYERKYEFRDTVIAVVTAYATPELLQADQEFARYLFRTFHIEERGIRELCICGGATMPEIFDSFRALIRSRFLSTQL